MTGLLLAHSAAGDSASPARIIQGIVAGIGFIGGGMILHRSDAGTVHGLTTAASIWIVSVTGVAVGAGLWRSAITAVVLSLLVLTFGRLIDREVHRAKGDDTPHD